MRARSTCPIHRRGWGQREVIELLSETPVPLRGQIRSTARVGASFRFTGTVWIWQGDSPWHFVSLPDEIADEIADLVDGRLGGFGSVRVEVASNAVAWRTSIFPSKSSGTYILPLKKQVREQLNLTEGSRATFTLDVIDD